MKVLLTNFSLNARGGAALYLRDIAMGLRRRGHKPIAYSSELGDAADELRLLTIPVISDLRQLTETPDIIHGHNNFELMTALLHFPNTPAVSFCHGWLSWQNEPAEFPRILKHVAVDEVCRDRLVYEGGISSDRVKLLLNFVDLERFNLQRALPSSPKRALVFSNGVAEGSGLGPIRLACDRAGLELSVIGLGNGTAVDRPEEVLPGYDIVFGKARCALEAMAAGCSVIVADVRGLASMVTSDNLESLRRLNFGIRTLTRPLEPGLLFDEIQKYSAADGARVTSAIRENAGLDCALDELVELYETVLADYRNMPTPDATVEMRAAAQYLRKVSPDVGAAGDPHDIVDVLPRGWTLTPIRDVTLDELAETESGRIGWSRENPRIVSISTTGDPWHYAAVLPHLAWVPTPLEDHQVALNVSLRVTEGVVGVGILNRSGSDFLVRQSVRCSTETTQVFLPLRRLEDAGDFVVQAWDEPTPSSVVIERLLLSVVERA